jgi:hypothetical protein
MAHDGTYVSCPAPTLQTWQHGVAAHAAHVVLPGQGKQPAP